MSTTVITSVVAIMITIMVSYDGHHGQPSSALGQTGQN
jgi:hypothetical protein